MCRLLITLPPALSFHPQPSLSSRSFFPPELSSSSPSSLSLSPSYLSPLPCLHYRHTPDLHPGPLRWPHHIHTHTICTTYQSSYVHTTVNEQNAIYINKCEIFISQKISSIFVQCDRVVELFNRLFLAYSAVSHALQMYGLRSPCSGIASQPTTVLQSRHTPPIHTPHCTHLQSVKETMTQNA